MELSEKTRKEIERLIELNEIRKLDDERFGSCIADRFPEMYSDEQEYIEFNEKIGSIVEEMKEREKDCCTKTAKLSNGETVWLTKIDEERGTIEFENDHRTLDVKDPGTYAYDNGGDMYKEAVDLYNKNF